MLLFAVRYHFQQLASFYVITNFNLLAFKGFSELDSPAYLILGLWKNVDSVPLNSRFYPLSPGSESCIELGGSKPVPWFNLLQGRGLHINTVIWMCLGLAYFISMYFLHIGSGFLLLAEAYAAIGPSANLFIGNEVIQPDGFSRS